jgi:hypothetical protein
MFAGELKENDRALQGDIVTESTINELASLAIAGRFSVP